MSLFGYLPEDLHPNFGYFDEEALRDQPNQTGHERFSPKLRTQGTSALRCCLYLLSPAQFPQLGPPSEGKVFSQVEVSPSSSESCVGQRSKRTQST